MQFIHHPDRAVVRLAGALCVDAVEELVDTVDMLCRVYFYSLIEIRIGSRGGTSAALGAYCDALARWRDAGVRVRTRAVTVRCTRARCSPRRRSAKSFATWLSSPSFSLRAMRGSRGI